MRYGLDSHVQRWIVTVLTDSGPMHSHDIYERVAGLAKQAGADNSKPEVDYALDQLEAKGVIRITYRSGVAADQVRYYELIGD